ncbi:MAG: outer membrane beta-barrel protein, partial [bacterium]
MKINKKGFLLCILLLLVHLSTAFGQLGLKGGLAVSGFQAWQDLRPYSGNDYRPFLGYEVDWIQDEGYPDVGFQVGVFYTKDLSKHFALQPELYYSQRGLHFYQTELYSTSYSLNVNYL